jgi:hypothetical protein
LRIAGPALQAAVQCEVAVHSLPAGFGIDSAL